MGSEIDRIANLLLDTWKRVDPTSGVAEYPASYVANFADMARAVVADRAPSEAAIRADERERLETRFWSITDPNSVPSDMWDALDRMASAYRARTTPEIGREE